MRDGSAEEGRIVRGVPGDRREDRFSGTSNLPKNRHRAPLFLHGTCGSLDRMDEKHVCPAWLLGLPFKVVEMQCKRNLLPPGPELEKNYRKPCL